MSTLGELLSSARETRALSLSEAASLLGCTKSHLHDMEAGRATNPALRTIAAVVIVYGLRPEAIVATAIGGSTPEGEQA